MKDDLISREAAIDVIDKIFPADPMRNDYTEGITCGAALATEFIKQLPSAEPKKGKWEEDPWSAVRTTLNELERKQEKLYTDYCDATARLKAINRIVESSQSQKQKIDGIKPLAEMVVTE